MPKPRTALLAAAAAAAVLPFSLAPAAFAEEPTTDPLPIETPVVEEPAPVDEPEPTTDPLPIETEPPVVEEPPVDEPPAEEPEAPAEEAPADDQPAADAPESLPADDAPYIEVPAEDYAEDYAPADDEQDAPAAVLAETGGDAAPMIAAGIVGALALIGGIGFWLWNRARAARLAGDAPEKLEDEAAE